MAIHGYSWSKMVQFGLEKHSKYENGQISSKQSWANILIFKSIRLFWTKIFIHQNICRFFSRVNLFGYSFVIFLCCRIGLDIHSSNIYGNKYIQIQIFIRQKKRYLSHYAPLVPPGQFE